MKKFLAGAVFLLLMAAMASAVTTYSNDFESDSTGSYPSPWQHHQMTSCGYSDCEVGHHQVIDSDSASGSKSLECLEESNGNRHCYVPVDVTSSTTVSFDYKLHVSDSWSHASVYVYDTSFNELENIVELHHRWDSSSETVGWASINDYDLSSHAGDTVYVSTIVDGRHSGAATSWVRLDNFEVDANINDPPSAPINPDPSDGDTVDSSSVDLNAEFNDPDGDSGTIDFYTASGSHIGSCSASDGNKCSSPVTWSGLSHGNNDWYATATDSSGETSPDSSIWTVAMNQPPEVDSLIRPYGITVRGNDTILQADVSDPNSGDALTATFYNNKTGSAIGSDSLTGSGTAEVIWSSGDLSGGDNKWWHVEVSDSWETSQSDDNASFYVNALPTIMDVDPRDGGFSSGDPTPLEVLVEDKESSSLDVYFYNESGDRLIGQVNTASGSPAQVDWYGRDIGDDYSWYVKVSDGMENYTSPAWSFKKLTSPNFRPTVRIEHNYASIVTSIDNPAHFVFSVENNIGASKSLNTSLHGVDAYFLDNGQSWRTYSLSGESSRRFQIRIEPDSVGDEHLNITTTNTDLGIQTTKQIPVYIRDRQAASTGGDVPGLGFLHLVVIVFTAVALYSSSL